MYRYLEGLSGPKHSPCRAAGILWACQDGEASRKQNPVKCMFSLHAWCTVGPQACGQRGLVGGVAPASVPPSHPNTFTLHETPSTSSPRSPLFPSGCSRDPGQLTSSRKGLVVATMDRPRDMFTASGGTEGTDVCMVTLRTEEAGSTSPLGD